MDCTKIIQDYLSTLKEGFRCAQSGSRLRIITPYLYPDHDLVEIFVEQINAENVRVTDLGETLRHLHSQGFDVFTSPKRRFMAETLASRVMVDLVKGQLVKQGEVSHIGDIIFDVIVAARSISDLIYTSKSYEPATFQEEVKKYLIEQEYEVQPRIKIPGESGKKYTVDFQVARPRVAKTIYLETLSPRSTMGVKPKVDATFRMWSDCNGNLTGRKFSLFNDIDFQWKEPDILILKKVSSVFFWSSKEELAVSLGRVTRK